MNTLHTYKASIYAALTVVVILSVYSCRADSGCTADIRTNIGVSFFGAVRDSAKNRFITTVLTDTIMVKGVGNDSTINDTLPISTVRLPLKPSDNRTAFVIRRDRKTADTVTIEHENTEVLVSLECGTTTTHYIREVYFSKNEIDSIIIKDRHIKDNKTNNQLQIYFKAEQ